MHNNTFVDCLRTDPTLRIGTGSLFACKLNVSSNRTGPREVDRTFPALKMTLIALLFLLTGSFANSIWVVYGVGLARRDTSRSSCDVSASTSTFTARS